MTIKLDAIEFTSSPTKSQFENTVSDIEKFLNKMVGMMLSDGSFMATDQCVGQTLNASIQLRQAKDLSAGNAGLSIPNPGGRPQMVSR